MRTEMGRTRKQQTGTRDWTNMSEGRWMKAKRRRGSAYVWVKKPKEQVEPNVEGMRGIKPDKGVNWATVSPTKRPVRH